MFLNKYFQILLNLGVAYFILIVSLDSFYYFYYSNVIFVCSINFYLFIKSFIILGRLSYSFYLLMLFYISSFLLIFLFSFKSASGDFYKFLLFIYY
jgi:hypothetical protein